MGNALSDCNNKLMLNCNNRELDEVANGYFNIIHQMQQQNYKINSNNSSNVAMSLDKKGFTTTITSTRRVIDVNQDIKIDWLEYLYYYLIRQIDKNKPWAQPVLNQIKNESFMYENEFQSEFFYKEFELTTKPIPIIKALEKMDQENILLQEYQTKRRKLSITKHFGGSFYADNVIQEVIPDDPTMEYKFLRQQIKQYVSVFNKQVQDSNHPINIVTIIFCEHFCEHVESSISNLTHCSKKMDKENYEEKLFSEIKQITFQLQKIIIKLQIILKLFYATTLNYSCFSEEKDEMINIITTLVFKQNCIYTSIFKLYQLSEGNRIKCLEEKFYKYKNIQPEELNINVKFRLDLSTLKYKKELLSQKAESNSKVPLDSQETKEILKGIDDKMLMPSTINSLSLKLNMNNDEIISIESNGSKHNDINIDIKSNSNKHSNNNTNNDTNTDNNSLKMKQLEKKKENLTQKGYSSAIRLFESIKDVQTPFEKMMIISKISEKITSSVNLFWKDMMTVITSDFLSIEVDTLMEIFIYLLINSQMTELPIHMQMVRYFTTNTTKTSMIGYYYTTLDAALNYIETSETIHKNDLFD